MQAAAFVVAKAWAFETFKKSKIYSIIGTLARKTFAKIITIYYDPFHSQRI
jgi:hypothetical protein